MAIAAGYAIGWLKLEKWVEPFVWELQKAHQGIAPETVLAFTMAVTALSLPEMVILRKVIRHPLTKTSFPSPRPDGHPSPAGEGLGVRAEWVG